jgi:hypothetical protein
MQMRLQQKLRKSVAHIFISTETCVSIYEYFSV